MLRAFDFAISKAALLRDKRDRLKPEVIWNIEEGLKLTVEQFARAEAQRVAMTARTLEFFKTYDLLLTPATIVAPFPVENRYVTECAGKKFDNYVEWLGIVYAITLVCCPALSLPCGFTASGLPVGLQMVAPPRGEAQLLAGARLLEDVLGRTRHHADRSEAAEVDHRALVHPHWNAQMRAPKHQAEIAASAALIAAASADLVCSTISSSNSSRLILANWPVSRPCSASVIMPCSAAQIFNAWRSRNNPMAGASKASSNRPNVSIAAL